MADKKSPLRRWKPFFPAFGAIDACIEAAFAEGCSRDKYRQLRGDIVELLCNAAGDDDGRAEELCRLLDVAMAEALETLRMVPVTAAMLTTTDVARAVGGLLGHESERVRGLARAVVSGWRASLEAALGTLLQISLGEHEVAAAAAAPPPPVVTGCVRGGGPAPEIMKRHWLKQEMSSKPPPGCQTLPAMGGAGAGAGSGPPARPTTRPRVCVSPPTREGQESRRVQEGGQACQRSERIACWASKKHMVVL